MNDGTCCTGKRYFFFFWLCESEQGPDKSIRGSCPLLDDEGVLESSPGIKPQGLTALCCAP